MAILKTEAMQIYGVIKIIWQNDSHCNETSVNNSPTKILSPIV